MSGHVVAVVGAGITEAPLGEALGDGDSKPQVFIETAMETTRLVVAAAAAAWEMAAVDPVESDGTECWLGTLYGTSHVSEYYVAALERPRPLLNPRAFTFSCLNSVSGAVASALGLTGAAITIIGQNAGADALGHACRSLELGRARQAVCGAFDFPSPFASAALEKSGITVSPSRGAAAVLILALEDAGRERGVPLMAIAPNDDGPRTAVRFDPAHVGVSPAVAPLLRLARTLVHDRRGLVGRSALVTPRTGGS